MKCKVTKNWLHAVYAIYFAGVLFREFRESGAIRGFNNTQKYPHKKSDPSAWMRLVYAVLVVHVQGRITNFALSSQNEWTDFSVHCSPRSQI